MWCQVNARKCAQCNQDVFAHSRAEVDERDMMLVLDASSDDKVSVIIAGQLMVGSFKAMAAELQRNEVSVAVNCAGTQSTVAQRHAARHAHCSAHYMS